MLLSTYFKQLYPYSGLKFTLQIEKTVAFLFFVFFRLRAVKNIVLGGEKVIPLEMFL